jgi:hypothetical protein
MGMPDWAKGCTRQVGQHTGSSASRSLSPSHRPPPRVPKTAREARVMILLLARPSLVPSLEQKQDADLADRDSQRTCSSA